MALIPWYKDSQTKEQIYYDTDDLSNSQYRKVSELEALMGTTNSLKEFTILRNERDTIIWRALHGSQD